MNVRSGPGTNYPVIGTASAGRSYPVTGKNAAHSWWRIDYNGRDGWVAASLTATQGDTALVSIVSTPAPPKPQSTPTPANVTYAITLLEPQPGFTGDVVTLRWQSQPLDQGRAFEPVVWRTGSSGDLQQYGMSPTGMTHYTSIQAHMSALDSRYPLNLTSGWEYYWGVCVVRENSFQRLYCTDGRRFFYSKASTSGGGGNPTPDIG